MPSLDPTAGSPSEPTIDQDRVRDSIRSGMTFLEKCQLEHGEFPTYLDSDPSLGNGILDSSAFVTTHVLFSIHDVSWPGKSDLIEKALSFFADQREVGGIWRYYSNLQWKHCRIPPDVDSTSCISQCIEYSGAKAPNNLSILKAMQNQDGLYYTWIEARPEHHALSRIRLIRAVGEWLARKRLPEKPAEFIDMERFILDQDQVPLDDIDPVVNANVLLYLGPGPDTEAIPGYLHDVLCNLESENYSLYYHNPLILLYAISRALAIHSLLSEELIEIIQAKLAACASARESEASDLDIALEANTRAWIGNFGSVLRDHVSALLSRQHEEGWWKTAAFYSGPMEHWGSEALTTGLAIEALQRYQNHCRPSG